MSDKETVEAETSAAPAEVSSSPAFEPEGEVTMPEGWMYRQRRFLGLNIPWYASPKTQLIIVAFVCFMCPGMFNALGGMGGGGKTTNTTADNMNTALYSTFAVFGFFGGTFINKLGVKYTLAFGGTGYCIYAVALLVSVHSTKTAAFNIVAGVYLGLCAGLLWTAQGTIMISYPPENKKGKYFALFWGIFNMGSVIGSLIPLGQNIHVKTDSTVTDGTYIAFIVLMVTGAVLAMLLCNAGDVIREDGSRVVLMKHPSWQSEFIGLYETIRFEPFIILLFPMFFCSNWFYVYQQNSINGARFDTRTKALNALLYNFAQIWMAAIWGISLDWERFSRSTRAKACLVALTVYTVIIWTVGYEYQKGYTRATAPLLPSLDWTSHDYVGPMFLYIFYGAYDAAWQASVYWFMGSLSNSGRRLANYVGFYKGIQSIGSAVMASLDAHSLSYRSEFISNYALLMLSLLCAAPVIFMKIKDHVTVEEDLEGTDETLADVLPQGHPEKVVV